MSRKLPHHQKLFQEIQFSERLIDTSLWIQKAEELQAAAAVLEVDIRLYWSEIQVKDNHAIQMSNRKYVQGPYSMLMAYAIENYFKAILIHRDTDFQRNRMVPNLPTYIKKHDLVKLANKAKVTLDLSEEELLNRLSRNSIWAARYPIPTSPDALTTEQKLSDGTTYLVACLAPHDIDRINKFIVRLRDYVNNEIQNSQP